MNKLLAATTLLLLATPAVAQPASFNSDYTADARTFPNEACPAWQSFDNATPEEPSLLPGMLLLETSQHSENVGYIQLGDELEIPDPLVIEFGGTFVSGTTSNAARTAMVVGAVAAPDEGFLFYVGSGEAFLTAGESMRGPTMALDTSELHTYRIEAHANGLVEVFVDGDYLMAGSTYVSVGDFGGLERIFWGEGASGASGRAEWSFVRHNAHATGCPDVDEDGDGATVEVDCDDQDPAALPGAPEVFDGTDNDCDGLIDEDLDDDLDGIPNFNDSCPGTAGDVGVDANGCEACGPEPSADGEPADCDPTGDDEDRDDEGSDDEATDDDDDREHGKHLLSKRHR